MKINLFAIDNFAKNNLATLFSSIKKIEFVFRNISLLNNFKSEDNLILVPPKIKKKSLKESIKTIKLIVSFIADRIAYSIGNKKVELDNENIN